METTDYFVIGDIVLVSSLSLLSSTSYNHFQLVPTGKKASEAQLDYQPYLQITGIIDSVAPDCSYWDMCPEQYIAVTGVTRYGDTRGYQGWYSLLGYCGTRFRAVLRSRHSRY